MKGPGNHFFGVPFFLGKKHNEKTKEKISEANSGVYKLTDPTGIEIIIKNLKQFCKKYNLNNSLLVAVSKGKRKTHKGWKAVKIKPVSKEEV